MLPITVPDTFRIIAHRGASAYAPENTRAAFKLAADMRVREFELDVQLSIDEQVVICHDLTLEKYGYGPKVVEQMRWDELARLDMGTWFSPCLFSGERMLTLAELFTEYERTVTYHIEIKGKAQHLPQTVCQLIDKFNLQANCIITSFYHESLIAVKSLNASVRLGWLVAGVNLDTIATSKRDGFFQLCPRADTATKDNVKSAHHANLEVRAWGVNGERSRVLSLIQQLKESYCNGMTINWPDWVIHEGAG